MASAQLHTLVAAIRSAPSRADLDVQQLRDQMEAQARAAPAAADIRCRPVEADGVPCEWVLAPACDERKVVLYLHGGGYYRGSLNTHRDLCSRISRAAGWAVLNVGYRLAPEHRFPAPLQDALAAYRWLLGSGVAPDQVVVAGDSAGGGLAAALMLALRDGAEPRGTEPRGTEPRGTEPRGAELLRAERGTLRAGRGALPCGAVLLSPWTDLEQTGPSMLSRAAADPSLTKAYLDRFAAAYLNGANARDPLASPWYGDLRGLPPLLIQVGTAEILEDDAARFAEKAQAAGVIVRLERWPDMIHVWQRYAAQLPEAAEAIAHIGVWLRELRRT